MYFLVECTVCIGLALGVASGLFGLCILFVLLWEACRQLRSFVGQTINSFRQPEMERLILRPARATWDDKPASRNISTFTF